MRIPSPNKLNYPSSANDRAEKEEEAVARRNLEKQHNAHRRGERFREIFSTGMQSLFVTMIAITIIAVLVVAWHHLTPEKYAWLSEDQLQQIRTFLFSGAVISAVSSHIQRHAW